jgi:peptidoglycan/xylan/chitin deacetylase (PgdA/CDA1 family)
MFEQGYKWPDGIKCAVMLSFDFDAETNWMARDPLNYLRPAVISQGTYGAKVGVHRILDLLKEEGIKGTFFTPGWVVDNRTEAVEKVLKAGHELGHHGYLHKPIQPGDADSEISELERGLDAFKRKFGLKPLGFRAPYADTSPNLLKLLSKHGFLYDSTLLDDVRPYRTVLEDGSPGPIELPWHWSLDDAVFMLFSMNVQRPIFTNEHILSIWKKEFEESYNWGGYFCLLMHPQCTGRPSRIAMLREFIQFTRQFENVWYATGGEIAETWVKHNPNHSNGDIVPFVKTYK